MTQSAETLGYGETFQCPFEAKKSIRLSIEDRGAYELIVDENGNALVDEGGNTSYQGRLTRITDSV